MSQKDGDVGTGPAVNPGLSAFASLLDPNNKSDHAEPVSAEKERTPGDSKETKEEKPTTSSSFAFKPVKRPQIKQPSKLRPGTISKAPVLYKQNSSAAPAEKTDNGDTAAAPSDASQPEQTSSYKPSYQDWMDTMPEDEDAAAAYAAAKQQNRGGGRQARKRKRKQQEAEKDAVKTELTNWKAIYDPSRPNQYALFKGSDEFYDMVYEWKDFLHARADARKRTLQQRRKPAPTATSNQQKSGFAPPDAMSFGPPAVYDDDSKAVEDDDEPYEPPPPVPVDQASSTGGDAYAQRMAMSSFVPPPPASAAAQDEDMEDYEPPPPPPAPSDAAGPASRGPTHYDKPQPPPASSGSISRQPVFYNNAPSSPPENAQSPDVDMQTEPQPPQEMYQQPSKRPGQKDFAKRMMAKMGWEKGSGLGAEGTGIATPLSVQLDKRLKRSSAEGGGFVGPAGKGRIVGGKLSKEGKAAAQLAKEKAERIGELSEVVVLDHMLDGQEIDTVLTELNFYQALGDECGEKYGDVERIKVLSHGEDAGRVFVKFVAKMSAMKALQGYQGREYGGNVIEARYFDPAKFEKEVMGA